MPSTGDVRWLCICDCGKSATPRTTDLRSGNTKSCGCLAADTRRKHGLHKTPEYHVWADIKQRCFNQNSPEYENYGGRGITMCQRWVESYAAFYLDMGARPSKQHSIERVNNNGHYQPGNCRWATSQEQTLNMRRNRVIEFNGASKPISEWAKALGFHDPTLRARLTRLGWSIERSLTQPVQFRNV